MSKRPRNVGDAALEALWAHHHGEFRQPHSVAAQWQSAADVDPELLRYTVRGDWWEAVARSGRTLIVTREYEHLVMALGTAKRGPVSSFLRLPHPNGLAVDQKQGRLYIASTRNPNMIFEFLPCSGTEARDGAADLPLLVGKLLPSRTRYLPGCLYIHDLALMGRKLYANAVAMNAIIELPDGGGYKRVWWPRSIDSPDGRYFGRNYLQLNSIAPGQSVRQSFFSASAATPSARRPGHLNFPVDKRGVIFSGQTRDVIADGLTRPHSARLIDGAVWVDNSGYGAVGRIVDGRYEPVLKLPGWTRGLCQARGILFVGTSRVIPRFKHYAPGIDSAKSRSGVHAIDLRTGRLLGSLFWPRGNQIFAVEQMDAAQTSGFPFAVGGRGSRKRLDDAFFRGMTRPSGNSN